MTIDTGLESVKHLVAFNKFAKDSLVAIKVARSAESDGELRSARVLAIVGDSQLATFIVSHSHVLVLKAHAKGTDVLLTDTAARDSKSAHALMELTVDVGITLRAIAESLERFRSLWLSLRVQLENELSDALVSLGHR